MARAAFAVCLAAAAAQAGEERVPEPDGYRMEAFRAPVPATLRGATVVDTAAAHALWRAGETVFIDVLPRAVKPEGLPEGTLWRDRPRDSIPGAFWLPNVGYGALHPDMDARFRAALREATAGDLDRPLLFFCLDECWMSWNAAKRALREYGHSAVFWYPEGTDGWSWEDHPVERATPAEGF
ncbi:MAG: PQQ-dependent catabolism-associated CXXCW motif protein [Rubrimonas sp.]|uniref:PQQ-dependent catabolism-associated CXXCW motif protein n=1 Tax=Rubrimonas sp. TaxID=2036015 RepID=UPI003DCFF196